MFTTAVFAMVTEEKLHFIVLCLFKSHQGISFKKSMDFTENEENTRTDQNYIMEICESVMQLYNAALSGRGNCIKRGFRVKDLLKFPPFLERSMNMSSNKKNICRNLAFFLVENKSSCS